jgi:tripartite-type tricarboxylate transporter receptor subunit TctC
MKLVQMRPQTVSMTTDSVAEARKRIAAIGGEPGRMTPAEFARYIRVENVRWRKLFSDGRLRVEP